MVIKPYKLTNVDHSKTINDAWREGINLLFVVSVAAYPYTNKIIVRMINKQEYFVHDSTYDDFMNDMNEAHGIFAGKKTVQHQAAAAAITVINDEEEAARNRKKKRKELDLD